MVEMSFLFSNFGGSFMRSLKFTSVVVSICITTFLQTDPIGYQD